MSGIKQDKSISQLGIKQNVSRYQLGHKSYGPPMMRQNTLMKADNQQGIQNDSNHQKMEPMGLNIKSRPQPKPVNIERAPRKDRNGYNYDKNYTQ